MLEDDQMLRGARKEGTRSRRLQMAMRRSSTRSLRTSEVMKCDQRRNWRCMKTFKRSQSVLRFLADIRGESILDDSSDL